MQRSGDLGVSGLRCAGMLRDPVPVPVAKMSRWWLDCVFDATKWYSTATRGLKNIMFLNTIFLALNVHFERIEASF
jgi:hypothetical protein